MNSAMNSPPSSLPRYRHRKRFSAIRLSTDSVTPLPAYTSPQVWQESLSDIPSDRPPDYPNSADEADADTEDCDTDHQYTPRLLTPPLSPRRSSARRYPSRRRVPTSSDPYLDSLLARSVHALELSNTLLQSSMSTQSSLSLLLSPESPAEKSLEEKARILSDRINDTGAHEDWMDDLDKITKGVEGLLAEECIPAREDRLAQLSSTVDDGSVSRSLPTTSSIRQIRRARRRPSLDLRSNASCSTSTAEPNVGSLHFTNHDRSHFIAPAPRPLTFYVASTDDPEELVLPSTLGVRTTSMPQLSRRSSDASTSSRRNKPRLRSRASSPVLSHRQPESSTKAYDLLSSFVTRNSSPASSSKDTKSSSSTTPRITSPERNRIGRHPSASPSRSVTPKRHHSPAPLGRPMTPPIEELSASSSSSSSDAGPNVTRTLQSLRKILDDQPLPPPPPETKKPDLPRPSFLPRSPPPPPSSGTSTATASISRLFTKGRHHSSTRAPSPPRHSSLKQPSAPSTPNTTPSTPSPSPSASFLTIPDFIGGNGYVTIATPTSSSGRSTPKRISFAELPESYAGTRPDRSSLRFGQKSKGKRRSKSLDRSGDGDREGSGGWWTGWLLGPTGTPAGGGLSASTSIDRADDRDDVARGWGGRARFGGGMEDWAI
ncbi:hypothetical protein JAAARDRAFT_52198 [Jaapia argillacea MUCL 33604]|uniref:Uncharacterized protein n=1 Tax=Jaapia argillacea MUCL 33604 TaxID=933084 RepID=A0A067QAY2_9AGAM|nr:hypothetical protein JAAARDRAFT_52198 [Jaapia argillacea MUCL 33604]